jgi:hypothetical protein
LNQSRISPKVPAIFQKQQELKEYGKPEKVRIVKQDLLEIDNTLPKLDRVLESLVFAPVVLFFFVVAVNHVYLKGIIHLILMDIHYYQYHYSLSVVFFLSLVSFSMFSCFIFDMRQRTPRCGDVT